MDAVHRPNGGYNVDLFTDYLRPYLNHSFQNVRERLGSLLINIFEADLEFGGANAPECPRIKDFMAEMLARLQILNDDIPEQMLAVGKKDGDEKADKKTEKVQADEVVSMDVSSTSSSGSPATVTEYEEAIRLFKTGKWRLTRTSLSTRFAPTNKPTHPFAVCHWITGIINRSTNGNRAEFFQLLPLACRLERCEQDDELAESCSALLAMIAQALTLADVMPVALDSIEAVSQLPSWSARVAVLDLMQVLVFNNMPVVSSQSRWVQQVQAIVLRLMEDPVLEVRAKAAQVLCGLLHCSFLPATDKLLELFKRKCRTKVPKPQRRADAQTVRVVAVGGASFVDAAQPVETESMRKRHMGVMGLCAFISAYPYDIPDFVPDVFEHLGAHLNDPQPIPVSETRVCVRAERWL